MSTFIKVTQEGSQLLQRNAQQTQAARLSKVEGDEQAKTRQQAQVARQQALLQQGLDASGDPFGDRNRRRFRLDEPAATYVGGRVLLVTWNGIKPVLSDSRAILLTEELSPNSSSTTITAGGTAAALGITGSGPNNYSTWNYRTAQCKINGRSDFTYETWVSFASSELSMVIIGIDAGDDLSMEMRYFYLSGSLGANLPFGMYYVFKDPIDGFSSPNPTFGDLATPNHICMMRKDGIFQWAVNGRIGTINPSDEGKAILAQGDTTIFFAVYATGNLSPNKLGPLRLDPDRARYVNDFFTPDPLPFKR